MSSDSIEIIKDSDLQSPPPKSPDSEFPVCQISADIDYEIVDDLVDRLHKIFNGSALTPSNALEMTVELMKVAETYKHLDGSTKKVYVIHALQKYVEFIEQNEGAHDKVLWEIVDKLIPTAVDIIIKISKNRPFDNSGFCQKFKDHLRCLFQVLNYSKQ